MDAKKKHTHYSYISGPHGIRQPTGIYNLEDASLAARRALINKLSMNGELLAQCPFACEFEDVQGLRAVLAWLRQNKGKNKK